MRADKRDPEKPATEIRWDERGLVPAIVQDVHTGQVLMLAYMNEEALQRTLETAKTWFWSRSRGELWHKGATSGNTQRVMDLRYDCDEDTLLVRVEPAGPACHTGQQSCFYRRLPDGTEAGSPPAAGGVLPHLEAVIQDRKAHPRPGSYTCQLFEDGLPRIVKKVGEEAIEMLVAAQSEGDERVVSEAADLLYHTLVLLAARGLSWAEVEAELARRFGHGPGPT
jgi:phosphoribosyl-AMP cyclohydrolase / phosphoribosyl-ATP pyrophosphohydrolase